jgi:hypothetical protein
MAETVISGAAVTAAKTIFSRRTGPIVDTAPPVGPIWTA